jgi:DNA-binding NarL/FixJ family response regulator
MPPIKILLADDGLLFRKVVSFLLGKEKNIEIIFEASNGTEIISFLNQSELIPDIILMDLEMPLLNGVEATKIIHKSFPNIKIIALTAHDSETFIANMIHVGAVSFIEKNATPEQVIFTINEVFDNGFYYNNKVLEVIQKDENLSLQKTKSYFDKDYFTQREKEILKLVSQQYNSIEIGEKLFISPRTVDVHRKSLLEKTESKNVAGLLVFALRNKIISLEDLQN